jgi:hypothetical protein
MTTSTLGTIIIVIVVAAGLAVWLIAVFHAERHPQPGRGRAVPGRKISGGIFRGDPRQQTPRRDAPAEVPGPGGEPGRGEPGPGHGARE